MGTDLGARLVQAGLVTRAQLRQALERAPANEGALIAALADAGVDEDGLAGFFIAHGLGPLVAAAELVPERRGTLARVPGRMAHALHALPLKETPAGLVVAMVAPSDAHVRAELARTAGGQILPALARATDLSQALRACYPDERPSDRPAVRDSEPPVLELVKRRPSPVRPSESDARAAVSRPEADVAVPLVRHKPVPKAASKPVASKPRSGETAVAATDSRSVAQARNRRLRKKSITRDFEAAPKKDEAPEAANPTAAPPQDDETEVDLVIDLSDLDASAGPTSPTPARGWSTTSGRTRAEAPLERAAQEAAERVARASHVHPVASERPERPAQPPPPPEHLDAAPLPLVPSPAVGTHSEPPVPLTVAKPRKMAPRSIIPPDHDSWEPGLDSAPSTQKVNPRSARRVRSSPAPRPAPIGGTLAAIRASRRRDDVVELACQGALTVARAAVLLALRKNVLKGLGGAGVGLSRDAIRNLWIPTSSPSMFRDVALHQVPYAGAHGTTAADGLFRAALGSRGGDVALMPVLVGGKLVAVLAASEVRFGAAGVERVEILARAVGEGLERIIVDAKKQD